MRLDKFREKAQEALQEAADLARNSGQQAVEPEHLLLALLHQEEGVARTLLECAGVSVQALAPGLSLP
jgi:ATP-dependent Clp protease ATP-binding subunit ClpB